MSTSIQCISSTTKHGYGFIAEPIAARAPAVNTDNWITEWTGARGQEIVTHAVTQAKTPLTPDRVNLVVQYLKKNDIFGLADIEKAAGGKEELTKLLGKYNPEQSLPLDIDDAMQQDLSQLFSEEALGEIPGTRKVTELYSLYWSPAGMTANIAQELAKKYGQKFHPWSWSAALREHGGTPTSTDGWIQFPNDVFGRDKSVQEQEALVPACFEIPHFSDAVFCIFMKYITKGTRTFARNSLSYGTFTRCQEQSEYIFEGNCQLLVGGFAAEGLLVIRNASSAEHKGIAVVRKIHYDNASEPGESAPETTPPFVQMGRLPAPQASVVPAPAQNAAPIAAQPAPAAALPAELTLLERAWGMVTFAVHWIAEQIGLLLQTLNQYLRG